MLSSVFYCPSCGEERLAPGKDRYVYTCQNCFSVVRIEFTTSPLFEKLQAILWDNDLAAAQEVADAIDVEIAKRGGA